MSEFGGFREADPPDSAGQAQALGASDSAARLGTGAVSPSCVAADDTGRAAERRTHDSTFGIGAMLRRHPQGLRASAIGAIFSGAVLFVVASVATAAGADPARPLAAPGPSFSWPVAPEDVLSTMAIGSAAPTHSHRAVAKVAPADPAAISSLAANGIPSVALNAYRVAAARLANTDPGCGVDWALLAGIGREESDHGQFAGAVLHTDGISTPRIIGIPLNGHGTALIRDTDHGVLDGDTVYDRAVGPMQFIPSTWAIYGTDADGDGRANVFDINDAALTAARYLCAAGGDLRSRAGQVRAVLAYNESAQYLAQVLALADAYRNGIDISGLPVGNVTGALPPVRSGPVPPANPGGPTANQPAEPTAPKPGASTPATSTAAPTPGSSSASSAPGTGTSSSSTPPPSVTPTTSATPDPSPTRQCLVYDLVNPGHCIIWAP